MLKKLTTVGTTPVLITIIMLFMAHLQPLDITRMIGTDINRAGRLVLDLLPYGLVLLGMGIGIRFHICGVMIAMLTTASIYLALMLGGKTAETANRPDLWYSLPLLLIAGGLPAVWTENVSWHTGRGRWALLLIGGGIILFGLDQLP